MSVPAQSSPMGSPRMMAASVRFGVRMSAPQASSAMASHSSGVYVGYTLPWSAITGSTTRSAFGYVA